MNIICGQWIFGDWFRQSFSGFLDEKFYGGGEIPVFAGMTCGLLRFSYGLKALMSGSLDGQTNLKAF
jgi:hypothetical protein